MPFRRRYSDAIVTSDSFGRADGTALGVTDAALGGRFGFAWTEEAGNWEINGGRLGSQGSSPGGLGWLCKCDPGFANLDIQAQYDNTPAATTKRLRFRIQDASNWLCLNFLNAGISFADCIAGVITSRGVASTGLTVQAQDIFRVIALGNSLTGFVVRAGAVIGTPATATIATFNAATGIGFRAPAADDRWRNLIVRRAFA